MKKYQPKDIEKKWQDKWAEDKIYEVDVKSATDPYYVLVELSYSSGDLHIGHWFTFSQGDAVARFKRMQGYSVVYPNGFDAFGLPAENAAIKRGIHPQDWTLSNIKKMREQFDTLGASFEWRYTMVACDPKYYKWNQWIFLKLLEKGLAYKGKVLSNWCPIDQTVLANENVEAGKCWRCGAEVVQKEIEQWFIKITDYADRLIWPETPSVDWPKSLREGQNNWIGKSEGTLVKFDSVEVFTTRIDTIYGATFLVLAPEHPEVKNLTTEAQKETVERYVEKAKKKSELERKENKDKTGVFTGSKVKNPLSGEEVPVWIADYVLPGYGTGAIMAVPAHDERDFEFAQKFDLKIEQVIGSNDPLPFLEEGPLINSGDFNDLNSSEARERLTKYIEEHNIGSEKVQYHLHDWSISRQRYWGTPVPIIHCPKCGMVPVPEADLPVELPYKVDYMPKGKPPLATAEEWVNVKCPKCGGDAKREAETMDTFIDSAWYFFRYLDPNNDQEIFDPTIISKWMPLEIYIGGPEHTLGHALYSRFITKFFKDIGLVNFDEYAKRRIHHGVILGPDGARMSKSKGNVVNPDDQVKDYGADAVRVYLSFLGPYDIVTPWKAEGINGVYHFLQRVWGLSEKVKKAEVPSSEDLIILNKTVQKITKNLDDLKFNTSIASLMEWLNHLSRKDSISEVEFKTYLKLLAPFAPHMTEELWHELGESESIHIQNWPKVDEKYLEDDEVSIAIQVNGKVRDQIVVQKELVEDQEAIEKLALESQKVQKFLNGAQIKKKIYIKGKIFSIVS